ncbi:hypothetical protein ACIG0C_08105 [Kitasatospora aureofaciens]|uniref:Uncharacterized protein n=1 Tax=Kitasatospora aureofaciens TaxID=1894 RepID=A0A8H9LPP2_KITAU|nr:hypothetical protein [Kitasatospora aureofaciens]ARF77739.1 hypothetical protein B6264_01295 [Kitasatospora aureofaciens]QEU98929.1 hypothetical protein CP971_06105 [Streptomyces viridifaciens]UKZ04943.1 hypothetical protein BOQ63_012965 [Streptomyces viridifaciens]GGU74342.1 hypothetical protein GCM10010502_27660 [Kitasatospora aureofaciens]
MEHMQVRTRPRVPAIQCGVGATGRRIDRHLAVLGAPALSAVDTAEALGLIRELTPRGAGTPAAARRRHTRVSLLAPLRRLRRSLFGGRG